MKKVFTNMLISKKSGFLPWFGRMCLLLFTSFLVHAHVRVVSATVKDNSGHPLLEADGVVKATSNAITTDKDARHFTYLINIESELNQI